MNFLNISGYKFISLNENALVPLKARLKNKCTCQGFKGTILLSEEGINLFIAGPTDQILEFKTWMKEDPRFETMEYNESYSDCIPFNRMLVKIKKEIIAFGHPNIQPEHQTAPYIKPHELKKMLDNEEDVNLLDTRNQYETRLGTFEKAQTLEMDVFRAFPEAAKSLEKIDKSEPMITFCTGGIRCEKASAFLIKKGFKNVFQLKGGILKYFNECGQDHLSRRMFCLRSTRLFESPIKRNQNRTMLQLYTSSDT